MTKKTKEESRPETKSEIGFLSTLGAPARRALENKGIKNLKHLSQFTEREILKLHGLGKTTIPKLKDALKSKGLKFRDD